MRRGRPTRSEQVGGARQGRRRLLGLGAAGLGAALASACAGFGREAIAMARRRVWAQGGETAEAGRLLARPGQTTGSTMPGVEPLALSAGRDGLLYVPPGYSPERPAPLAVMLHGAGGNAQGGLSPLLGLAEAAGLILLAPDSRGRTWDLLLDDYGPDVAYIDAALGRVFERCAVDPSRVAVGGFSDGASYALSIGLTNGDLFTHVVAFSPGFAAPAEQRGAPAIYVSHGTNDSVLPIDACSRRIVPVLEQAGYAVRYHEFDGPHTVPPEIAREALDWFLGPTG